MRKFVQSTIVVCASLAMLGCMTVTPLSANPSQLRGTLAPGDHVEVVTTSGQQMELTVDRLDENGLEGEGRHIAYSDIRSISRKHTDAGRTTLLVLGVVAAGALAAAAGGGGGGAY